MSISDREQLFILLNRLNENAEPLWGTMTPQSMIEHLVNTLRLTNGKKRAVLKHPAAEAEKAKEAFIYTDFEMPRGLKSSTMPDEAEPFEFPNLQEAVLDLNKQLDDFEEYFKINPAAEFIHPRLGSLNHSEWIILNNKHFTHHFKQFGLVS